MKPYFAKYIDAEGEVTPGDYYIQSYSKRQIGKANREDYLDKAYLGYQKVRFSLCSRNIKIGDKLKECLSHGKERIVHHFETIFPYGVFVFEPWPSEKEEWIQANLAFKVLGQISHNATWVKEGDEFDEDDIERRIIVKDSFGEDDYTELNTIQIKGTDEIGDGKKWGDELINIKPIKIKGPCGHFH